MGFIKHGDERRDPDIKKRDTMTEILPLAKGLDRFAPHWLLMKLMIRFCNQCPLFQQTSRENVCFLTSHKECGAPDGRIISL